MVTKVASSVTAVAPTESDVALSEFACVSSEARGTFSFPLHF